MIESNIIDLAELQEIIPKIEIYNKPKIHKIFLFFYLINKYKPNQRYLFYIIKLLYFMQIIKHLLLGLSESSFDFFLKIINYFKYILFPHEFIDSKNTFYLLLIISYLIIIIFVSLSIYLFLTMKNNPNKKIIKIISFLSLLILNYISCPLINILCLCFVFKNNKHIYTNHEFFSKNFIFIVIFSSFCLFILLILMLSLSFFLNEIGKMNRNIFFCRTNTNFEIYSSIHSLIIYVFGFIHFHYYKLNSYYRRIYRSFILISSIGFYIYYY